MENIFTSTDMNSNTNTTQTITHKLSTQNKTSMHDMILDQIIKKKKIKSKHIQ